MSDNAGIQERQQEQRPRPRQRQEQHQHQHQEQEQHQHQRPRPRHHQRPRHHHHRLFSLGAALFTSIFLATCSAPALPGDCDDGVDNDGDGAIDYDDFGCIYHQGALEADPPQCLDGVDNDGDGLVDLDDYGCDADDDPSEDDPLRQCNDGLDNDDDGRVDHPADPGCQTPIDDDEFHLPQCDDGEDNDDDGNLDYPDDPGCSDPQDDDETTPFPLPACADQMDNDFDGLIDYPDDPGCQAAGDINEYDLRIGECGPSVLIEDITQTAQATGSVTGPMANELSSPECAGFGGEHAYVYEIFEPTALVISTDHPETTLDTVVYIRDVCRLPETEHACADDGGVIQPRASVVHVPYLDPGLYYIVVDSFAPGSLGDFKLTLTQATPLGGACDITDPDACIPGLECRETTPGAGTTCEYPACSDGLDNDGDTHTDHPFDPGCISPDDPDETDPATPPQCADGLDNDSDGRVDFPDDPTCQSAAHDTEESCVDAAPIIDISHQPVTMGSTVGAGPDQIASCSMTFDAPDVVHRLRIPGAVEAVTITTNGSDFDTVLYIRGEDCTALPFVCDDDSGMGDQSTLLINSLAAGVYHLIVDGWDTSEGNYVLTISGTIPVAQPCDPAQVAAGVFTCAGNSSCTPDSTGQPRCL